MPITPPVMLWENKSMSDQDLMSGRQLNSASDALSDADLISFMASSGSQEEGMRREQIRRLLTCRGELQEQLFRQAAETRSRHLGDEIKLRGVIEISNFCQKGCDYCAMRSKNSSLSRFRLDAQTVLAAAGSIADAGITTIFLQSGQDPRCDPLLEEVIPAISDLGAEVLLNVGERSPETYRHFARLGARSFILKFETSDEALYERIAHGPLQGRIDCMRWIREAGMKIGTGNIIGLPDQSIDSLVSDICLSLDFRPDFASCAPFIPNQGTPLQELPCGDLMLTLNTMAILRLGLPEALIPAVSALEYIHEGGQMMGLLAGANVMTVNFTPRYYRKHYNIYANDRFIVTLNHAINTARAAGLRINADVMDRMAWHLSGRQNKLERNINGESVCGKQS